MAGTSVCMGRLRGAMQLGCFGSSTKPSPRLWKVTPVLAVTMPVPKSPYSELMKETAMPFSSTMEKHTVSEPAGRGIGPSSGLCFLRSMRPASLSMVASSSMCVDRHLGHVGVGDEGVAHGKGQPGHLHQQVEVLDRLRIGGRACRAAPAS